MTTAGVIVDEAIQDIFEGRLYPNQAPAEVVKPYAVWQSIGGENGMALNGKQYSNTRVQISIWCDDLGGGAVAAEELMQQVEARLIASPIYAVPVGAVEGDFDEETGLSGARLDFSLIFQA